MRQFLKTLRNRLAGSNSKKIFAVARPADMQVIVPDAVLLPLPKSPREEISVPASVNGRDLSTGRL